jgi:hypothetical protein
LDSKPTLPSYTGIVGADPLVRGRRPRRPVREIDPIAKGGSRGTRADQGVRPTIASKLIVQSKLKNSILVTRDQAVDLSKVGTATLLVGSQDWLPHAAGPYKSAPMLRSDCSIASATR